MFAKLDVRSWQGRRALITGGLGFIGSNLAIRLADLGAHVTIVDAMIPEYGGNLFNIEPVRDLVTVNFGDVCDRLAMNWLVRDQDYVFHLAGQVSHVMSMTDPFADIEFNIKGTAVVMEAVRHHNPRAKVIFTGTRGQYGPATILPVSELAPTNPKAIYEVSNLTAEKIIQVYHETHGIPAVMLRLTNIYGPRGQMKHSQYGVVNWFVRQALDGEPIRVFGTGQILRDFVYVDDCVDAILAAATCEDAIGEIFNVGWDRPTSFLELAKLLEKLCESCTWQYAPFSPERAAQEPGDFYSDISKIRSVVGWEPRIELEDGLRRTLEYYRQWGEQYWQSPTRRAESRVSGPDGVVARAA
jgi:UDP-glucose 4-epimerase